MDTVGADASGEHTLTYLSDTGTAKERTVCVSDRQLDGRAATAERKAHSNLGALTGIGYLSGHVVEKVTKTAVLFTNGFRCRWRGTTCIRPSAPTWSARPTTSPRPQGVVSPARTARKTKRKRSS